MKGMLKLEATEKGISGHVSLAEVSSNDKANLLRAFLQGIQLDYRPAIQMIIDIIVHEAKEGDDDED